MLKMISITNNSNLITPPINIPPNHTIPPTGNPVQPVTPPQTIPYVNNNQQLNNTTLNPHTTPYEPPFYYDDPKDEIPQGHSIQPKLNGHVRFLFQNVNGLKWGNHQFDITHRSHLLQDLSVDFFGLTETNLNFRKASILHQYCQLLLRAFNCKIGFQTSTSTSPTTFNYQPGGTTSATAPWWTSCIHDKGKEARGTGLWSYLKLRGRNHTTIVFITIYRLCDISTGSKSGPHTVYSQVWDVLKPDFTTPNPNLRKACDRLLYTQLRNWLDQDFEIILMIDANEPAKTLPKGFSGLMHSLNLHDAFLHLHPNHPTFSTYKRGTKRIDFAFLSPNLLPHLRYCGYLPYSDGLNSDHRGLFLDFNQQGLLGHQSPILPPQSRILYSTHAERASNYLKYLAQTLSATKLPERTAQFETNLRQAADYGMVSNHHHTQFNALDRDMTRAMLTAEKKCGRHYPTPSWSPALQDAGLTVRYWKFRLQELRTHNQYTAQKQKIKDKIDITDNNQASLSYVVQQLRQHSQELRSIRKKAATIRESFLEDLASLLATHQRNSTKEKIIKILIASEAQRDMFRKCKSALKPTSHSGLSRLEVPETSITSPNNPSPIIGLDTTQKTRNTGYQLLPRPTLSPTCYNAT